MGNGALPNGPSYRAHPRLYLFGHVAISELSLLWGVKRKLDFEPAKGSFWREAVVHLGYDFVPFLSCIPTR